MSRKIPATNEIKMYYHCGICLKQRPKNISPSEWCRVEVGATKLGIQVWCKRHQANIVHVDFQWKKHPANLMCKKEAVLNQEYLLEKVH